MSDSTERLLVRIDATTESLRRELKRAEASVSKTDAVIAKAQGKMAAGWANADKYVRKHNTELKLVGAAAVAGTALAIKKIANYSDGYKNLQGQLKLVTEDTESLNRVYDRSLALSNATGATIESTVNLYARMTRATQDLALSEDQRFQITQSINEAMIVSGASSSEAEAAIIQLSQGMASGALRGEELNSVMEQSPRLARAIADGMGIAYGSLRDVASNGELTADRVTAAILNMSDEINGEFQQMPMTFARATNQMDNALKDAFGRANMDPLIDSVGELTAVLTDPDTIEGLTKMAGGIVSVGAAAASAVSSLPGFATWIGETLAAISGGPADGDFARMADRIAQLTKLIDGYENKQWGNVKVAAEWRKELSELQKRYGDQLLVLAKSGKALDAEADKTKEVVKQLGELNEIVVQSTRLKERQIAPWEKVLQSLEFEQQQLGRTAKEQFIYNQVKKAGIDANTAAAESIRKTAGALYDQQEAMNAAATATEEHIDNSIDPWSDALQGAAERIDGAFADAWRGAFDSFSSFADSLKDAFKNLLAELAHLAITRPIVMAFTAGMGSGLSGPASASKGGGGIGSIGSMLSTSVSGFGQGAMNALWGVSPNAAAGIYGTGSSITGALGMSSASAGTNFAVGSLANAGAGFAGNWLGGQVFDQGQYSNAGGTVGAIAGTLMGGPMGAAIGAFIGNGLGSLLSGTQREDRTQLDVDFATGSVTRGRSRGHDMDDAANQVSESLMGFAAMLGGSNASFGIVAHGEHGYGFAGEGRSSYRSPAEFMEEALDRIIKGATELSPVVKDLALAFDGTTDQLAAFTLGVNGIYELSQTNPIDDAVRDFAQAQEDAAQGITGAYNAQIQGLSEMISSFDGSTEAATSLNSALAQNKLFAYELAIAMQSMSDQMSQALQGSADNIRESVLSDKELDAQRRQERNALRSKLGTLVDPEEIARVVAQINELQNQIFSSLSEDQQAERADSFAAYLERVDEVQARQMERALKSVQASQEEMNRQISTMLNNSAEQMQGAGDKQMAAAELLYQAAMAFVSSTAGTEVVA